ncbi:Uncharacterised protein [Sphingobacterium multivorum]|nr:hypothetical protein HMPREF3127_10400 [Sphingobacterium sp. HMSC13C05]SUJ31709.1 Uncharacterised protein [Sphingobacterium multivorum]HAF33470.1 hypothetical protein [Sphingobacterium sp.]HAU52393.1 hypothetical protein [Sphingobacterium sp.]HBI88622.1 hypothetical protein [Sphingobacterium sp.]
MKPMEKIFPFIIFILSTLQITLVFRAVFILVIILVNFQLKMKVAEQRRGKVKCLIKMLTGRFIIVMETIQFKA